MLRWRQQSVHLSRKASLSVVSVPYIVVSVFPAYMIGVVRVGVGVCCLLFATKYENDQIVSSSPLHTGELRTRRHYLVPPANALYSARAYIGRNAAPKLTERRNRSEATTD